MIRSRGGRGVVALGAVALLTACAPAVPPSSAPAAVRSPVPPPADPGPRCPAEGVRLEADRGEAAMGLRVLGITLVNCGATTYRLTGYPAVQPLDEHLSPLDVRILRGVKQIIRTGTPWDGPPQPVTLDPGRRAGATVAWRNTYTDIRKPPADARFLRIEPLAGRPAQIVEPEYGLDLGSTGRLGVGPWRLLPDGNATPATPPVPEPVETVGPLP